MPEVVQLSPQGIAALIARFQSGVTNAQDFIEGLANQDRVLSAQAAQQMLDAGVISPQQFELISGRNTQLLPGSQGFFDRALNFGEGVAQDLGFIGEAGVSEGEQALRLATTALTALPGAGAVARGAQGTRALNALARQGPVQARVADLAGRGAAGLTGRVPGVGARADLSIAALAGGTQAISTNLLESDRESAAASRGVDIQGQINQQLAAAGLANDGTSPDAGLTDEEQQNAILAAGQVGDAAVTPGGGLDEEPFRIFDVPEVGRFLQFREDVVDPATGEIIGQRFSAPSLIPEEEERPALDAQTVLALTQQLADPAQRVTLQAGLASLLANSTNVDPTTQAIADLLGVRRGQTGVSTAGLPPEIVALFGGGGTIPVAGLTTTQTVNTLGEGEAQIQREGGIPIPHTESVTTRTQGAKLGAIPNLQALSDRELDALQALSAISGIDFGNVAELSGRLAPPGGRRTSTTVRR